MKHQVRKIGRLRAAFRDWLGIPLHLTDEAAFRDLFGTESTSGTKVTHHTILTLSTVWACTRLMAQAFSMLPLTVIEETSAGKRKARDHWLQPLIHTQPNPWAAAATFWEAVVAAMLLRGCAHIELMMIGSRIVGLNFLSPMRLFVSWDGAGQRRWYYIEDTGRQREIPRDRIWTIPGFSLDGRYGVSAIRYGIQVFGSALAADRAAQSTFEKGLMPTVALSYPKVLNPTQRDEARETLKKLGGAVNAGNPVVLEAETTIDSIGINPEDAQLLESRGFSVEEVCRWFGVDPTMIGHGEKVSNWGTGLEQKLIGFLTFTMGPIIRKVEQSISKDLLSIAERRRYFVKANIEGLLRADSAGRAAFYGAMVDHGIKTRDEVRELEDDEPMGGNAAKLTVQSAMTLLDSIGQTTPDRQARAALIEWLREEEAAVPASAQE